MTDFGLIDPKKENPINRHKQPSIYVASAWPQWPEQPNHMSTIVSGNSDEHPWNAGRLAPCVLLEFLDLSFISGKLQ
jgi:hypothetical protein